VTTRKWRARYGTWAFPEARVDHVPGRQEQQCRRARTEHLVVELDPIPFDEAVGVRFPFAHGSACAVVPVPDQPLSEVGEPGSAVGGG
jgi:hypothetical protein